MTTAYGGTSFPLSGSAGDATPTGVRRISLALALGAAWGVVIAVGGTLALQHLSAALPDLARAGSPDPALLVDAVHSTVWAEIAMGVVLAVSCGLFAVRIRRPSSGSRVGAYVAACVLTPILAVFLGGSSHAEVAHAAAGADPALAEALRHVLPGWYPVVAQVGEIVILLALLTVVLFLARRRFSDFYQAGRKSPEATFWASDKLNQGQ
jgi:hypothetical protein